MGTSITINIVPKCEVCPRDHGKVVESLQGQSVVRNIRKEEVVLARLRLGQTRVTHSYLLQGEGQPQCVGCDAPFTVRHFILECGDFAQVRNNCFHVDKMKELFQDIHIDSIMTFLRQINLFNKIKI